MHAVGVGSAHAGDDTIEETDKRDGKVVSFILRQYLRFPDILRGLAELYGSAFIYS
jgi:hypothetical protein